MAQETLSLAAETKRTPSASSSNYVAIGDAAELTGGGTVYLSRNRKAVAKHVSGEAKPPVYVTAESGTMQQSVPYRAVGTALARQIIPVAQVIELYAQEDMLSVLVDALIGAYGEDVACHMLDNHSAFIAENLIGDDADADADAGDSDALAADAADLTF